MASSGLVGFLLVTVIPILSVGAGVDDENGGLVRLNLQPLAQLVHVRNEKRRRRRRLQVVDELDADDYLEMEASFTEEILEMQKKYQVISGVYAASQLNLMPSQYLNNDEDNEKLFNETDGTLENYSRSFSKYETEARWEEHMRVRQRRLLRSSERRVAGENKESPFGTPEKVENSPSDEQLIKDSKTSPFGTPTTVPQNNSSASVESGQTTFKSSAVWSQRSKNNNPAVRGGLNRNEDKGQQDSKSPHQIAPLMQGYGTHYATAWVGTPPQRKSVIVDTGSHFTAFPCVGCKDCGEEHHTDKYFDPDLSSTFKVVGCDTCEGTAYCQVGKEKCQFSQSYTEGSSWHAYQVQDEFFLGGNDPQTAANDPADRSFSMPFMFGCQTSETGLFRTQLADGIMGMSAHQATLPKALYDSGRLKHNMFAMCFRRELSVSKEGVTAGVMTLGGKDSRLGLTPMVYAGNVHNPEGGWYTVTVRAMFILEGTPGMEENDLERSRIITADSPVTPVEMDVARFNNGKGVIVDSGTTDTYLSESCKKSFGDAWYKATGGKAYHHNSMQITREEMLALPTVLIQLKAYDGNADNPTADLDPDTVPGLVGTALDKSNPHDVLLAIPPTHYMEYSPEKETYTSRLYFTERTGGVLGANAMQGHDVLFDWENARVGFASSTCDHSDVVESQM